MASGKKQFILVLLGVLLLSSCVDLVRRPKVQNGPKDPALFGEWYDDGELKSLLADPERFESFCKNTYSDFYWNVLSPKWGYGRY